MMRRVDLMANGRRSRRPGVATAAALALILAATQAGMASTTTLNNGRTSVALSTEFLGALTALGVAPGVIKPGKLRGTTLTFPVPAGAVDLSTAKGEVQHTGGLTLTAGGTVVQLLNFTVDTTTARPVLTGVVTVNGALVGRLPLFDLALPQLTLPLEPSRNEVTIPNVGVTLSAEAAAALNSVFDVSAFAEGFPIGTATVEVRAGSPKARKLE
jgi:hypothetical protein